MTELEDLYLPYKQKRKTRATIAIEKGLEPLAKLIFEGKERDPEGKAATFLNDQVANAADALQGARDIIAEWINENQDARAKVRFTFQRGAIITSKVKKKKRKRAPNTVITSSFRSRWRRYRRTGCSHCAGGRRRYSERRYFTGRRRGTRSIGQTVHVRDGALQRSARTGDRR